ncbi:hypothetical protein [Methylobacterium sp. WL6]|uniref:hypothetical protein n=1 Tax=Methylobacterium sp. WL6 TaxID=2603901 RepID=UPI0011CA2206|nr:hypothetical protein [Methylobacterium sp. WL6]TXN73266.1 hypothetical protein FV230_01995 [Methylobacterium sp. WL6]
MPDAEVRRRVAAGEAYAAIGRDVGLTGETIRQRALRAGLASPRRHGRVPGAAVLRVAVLADAPLTATATAWGCAPASILRACRRLGLPTDRAGRAALRLGARS